MIEDKILRNLNLPFFSKKSYDLLMHVEKNKEKLGGKKLDTRQILIVEQSLMFSCNTLILITIS